MGWQNVGTKIKCLMKVQKLKQRKKQRAGKKERTVLEGGGDAPRYFMLTMELAFRAVTDQNTFQNLHVCKGKKKKASVMHSTVMTQFQIPSFIPIGLQGTLLKNLLPFHLPSNMTCFAALLQTHDIKSTDQSFQYLGNILLSWILAEQTPTGFFWLIKSTRLDQDLILKQLMFRANKTGKSSPLITRYLSLAATDWVFNSFQVTSTGEESLRAEIVGGEWSRLLFWLLHNGKVQQLLPRKSRVSSEQCFEVLTM